jgi:hypothetical protein
MVVNLNRDVKLDIDPLRIRRCGDCAQRIEALNKTNGVSSANCNKDENEKDK